MDTYVDFVSRLVYATGAEAVITPNHNDWVSSNPTPTGTAWLAHHVDQMLPAFESWLAAHNLPPIIPWNGVRPAPWDASITVPLGSDLDGSFTGIASLDDLGAALRDRLSAVAIQADELGGAVKAPFSYRYWGYVKWAQQMRDRYQGAIVLPPTVMFDRDGTLLSAIPFSDVFNELHWRWHGADGATPTASGPTPGLATSAGQRAMMGGVGMGSGEEFIYFHRDHMELFRRWLERTGQPDVRSINLFNGGMGWPPAGAGNPSTWVENDDDPWINQETGDTDNNLRTQETDPDDLGGDIGGIHGSGHIANSDIASIFHNNYVPRFFSWHGWIDNQLWWREPRFGHFDPASGLRQRVFRPVLADGIDWPGLPAVTILRDPAAPADEVSPAGAVAGLNLTTGAGTLKMKFLVNDSYNRPVTLRLKAEVFNDATDPTTPVETIPEATNTYTVGSTAAGDDFDLNSEFTVDFTFGLAFLSDDPGRANPAVGFANSRIRISGTLEAAGGVDPGFLHRDFCDIQLVQEKQAPEIDLYFDLSSYSEDQVDSAMSAGQAVFSGALIVVVQDRTSAPFTPTWPSEVANEVRGLITGYVPASGLFDDAAHAPTVEILQDAVDLPILGLSAALGSGPLLEDPGLPDNMRQRFTYRYDVVFDATNDAFIGLPIGGVRQARVRVAMADRSGNSQTTMGTIKLFKDANPYMRDDSPPWLSIDTRVFRLFEGDARFNATLNPGQPNAFIQQVIQNLNAGTAGADTFDGLPTDQPGSSLEYATSLPNPSTGTSQNVYNFALAKVRLQGSGGAADVRAFFRLFRYTETNLVFDPNTGYRTFDSGSGRKVPLLGFSSAAPGGQVTSIPFFAEPRLGYAQPMSSQTDPLNVQTFPPGPAGERVLYFGVYLDINQDGARLPSGYLSGHPDGGFSSGEVQSIRSLMTDAHQCMVVEINYNGDPTAAGDTPTSSDNLAQRNLMILYTDNPGAPVTHTVQHSFAMDTGKRLPDHLPDLTIHPLWQDHQAPDHHPTHRHAGQGIQLAPAPQVPMVFITQHQRQNLIRRQASAIAFVRAHSMDEMMHPGHFMEEAGRMVDERYRLVFDAARWQNTGPYFDELLFLWNDLPQESLVEVYLPRLNCEQIINLRNLRHAPGDVTIIDSHTLRLTARGATYLPIPPTPGDQIAGVITISLPAGIKKGQSWQVDVLQLRGGERRAMGGFQIDIQVSEAGLIAGAERRLLEVMFERLALTPAADKWHPVLERRVEMLRARARGLAEAVGIDWVDPTTWVDPQHPDEPHILEGQRVRVVLEKIQILDDHDPWIKGRGEVCFVARVHTSRNGGLLQTTTIPEQGVFKVSGRPGRNEINLDQVIFNGYATGDLAVEIIGTEEDTFDPDDVIGKYSRTFSGAPERWFGDYCPGDEVIDPEDLVNWRVWYRIERA